MDLLTSHRLAARLLRLIPWLLVWLLPAGAAGAVGVLDRLQETKTLTIAYSANAYPISFNDENGKPAGYSVDLCKRVAASIQRDLGLAEINIRWVEGNTPRRLAAVANREADMECGTTTMDLQRQELVDFSNIVFIESGGVVVMADSGLAATADLAGRRIAVVPDTTTERRLRAELAKRLISAELVPVKDTKDGAGFLMAGKADALAGDRLVLVGQVAATGTPERFAILDTAFSVDPYAFALVRNDADFRLAVNRGLARIYRGGEIDRIFARWFGTDAAPTELLEAVFFLFGFQD
jgi:ABC-type amino acid transport substrate-binding protein